MLNFKKAQKSRSKLRLALIGPSGAGKTYSALAIATSLEGPVAVIDTEHGSASKYADLFDFDVLELDSFSPETYVKAIQAAVAAGYKTVVIDSLSHAWSGKDGALEQVDRAAAAMRTANTFGAWRNVTPLHNQLVDSIVGAGCHVIATMRAKTEYVQEKDERTGRTSIKKVGLAAVQRDGMEYEFDLVGDVNLDHQVVFSKSRIPSLDGAVVTKPGADLAKKLLEWLDGVAPVAPAPAPQAEVPVAVDPITPQQIKQVQILLKELGGITDELKAHIYTQYGVQSSKELDKASASLLIEDLRQRVAQKSQA